MSETELIAADSAAATMVDEARLSEVKSAIVEYFVDNAGVPRDQLSKGDVMIESLGIDSLSMIEMLWEVEERFGVHVDDIKALKGTTLDALALFVTRLVAKPA